MQIRVLAKSILEIDSKPLLSIPKALNVYQERANFKSVNFFPYSSYNKFGVITWEQENY